MLNNSNVLKMHGDYWCNIFDCTVLHESRGEVFKKFCENKSVLHVGCTDYPFDGLNGLHKSITEYANVDGVDVDRDGIDRFKKHFDGNFYYNLDEISKSYDVILVPEVLEHVDNAGFFLNQINKINFKQLIVTVPDVLSCYNYSHFEYIDNKYIEACHPDHVAWYSPHTLKNIIEKNTNCKCSKFFIVNGRSIMTISEKVE